uniref:Putative secreted protein n=1 Tax=Lutzomyia longipalpis TaxID=7200 RepID=A0A7G3AQ13_LUTLO
MTLKILTKPLLVGLILIVVHPRVLPRHLGGNITGHGHRVLLNCEYQKSVFCIPCGPLGHMLTQRFSGKFVSWKIFFSTKICIITPNELENSKISKIGPAV